MLKVISILGHESGCEHENAEDADDFPNFGFSIFKPRRSSTAPCFHGAAPAPVRKYSGATSLATRPVRFRERDDSTDRGLRRFDG